MAEEKKKADAPAQAASAAAADKSHDKKDAHGGGAKAAGGGGIGGMLTKTPVLLGGVMIIEAAVLFAGFKFLGAGPKQAPGAELTTADPTTNPSDGGKSDEKGGGEDGKTAKVPRGKTAEIEIVDFRAPNKQSGRTFLYDVSIFAVVKTEHEDAVKETIKTNEALIKDRVRTIIAQLDPEKLGGGSEPGLETLRRQIKYQLDEIVGDGLIEEVLVPRCIPFRADY